MNILLQGSSIGPATDETCVDLLSRVESSASDLLLVTTNHSPDERLSMWSRRSGIELPAKIGIISVGEDTRSAAAAQSRDATSPMGGHRFKITTIPELGDLTGLGMRISQILEEWQDDENIPIICFDSLTLLIHATDPQRVFRFLHVLTRRLATVGGVACYHIDPEAHDDQTLATIRSLFDTVLEYRDGHWEQQ